MSNMKTPKARKATRKGCPRTKRSDGSQQRVVRRSGWAILHPSGVVELDYFHSKLSYNKYGGPPLTKEQWMNRYRPDCTLHRIKIVIAPNDQAET